MTRGLRRVCVIGAGLAGLACALAAASRGLRVQLLDDAPERPAVPAHIEVVPNMLRDLAELGVAEDCVRAGFAYRGVEVLDRQGRCLHQLPTPHLAGQRFPAALGIRHADLHQVLERAAALRGVALAREARVARVQGHGGQPGVVLATGESFEADLVLLATGLQGALRSEVFPQAAPVADLGQAWWYTLMPRPVDLDRPLIAVGDAGRRVVIVPVRHDVAGLALTEPKPVAVPQGPTARVTHVRSALASFAPRVRAAAAHLSDGLPVAMRPVRVGLLDAPWHRAGVLAVGDCAHALPPHLGQAAAQAIEDARVLGELMAQAPDRAALLDGFQRRRTERVQRVHELTVTAARWDLAPDGDADLGRLSDRLARTVALPA